MDRIGLDLEDFTVILHETFRLQHMSMGRNVPQWEVEADHMKHGSYAAAMRLIANPGMSVEEDFLGWREDAIRRGWKYGPDFSVDAMTTPRLVGCLADLPKEDQALSELILMTGRLYLPRVQMFYGLVNKAELFAVS